MAYIVVKDTPVRLVLGRPCAACTLHFVCICRSDPHRVEVAVEPLTEPSTFAFETICCVIDCPPRMVGLLWQGQTPSLRTWVGIPCSQRL